MINSVNFIDGLDGLSSGIAMIAALTLGAISLTADPVEPYVAMFCFALAGALAGFLRWNFHPASVFAGTSGIMLVGYVLAVLSILGTAKIAVAALVLGVPIIDTFWIIVRRLAGGRSPFSPDRGHIHHRLLDLGLSHRGSVLLLYAVCLVLAGMSLALSNTGQLYAFMGLAVVFGLGLFVIERLSDRSVEAVATDDGAPDEARGD
jgi:UDP-GlcNAc:undecaprenyl-phosphate GlcNAc-1-phosphate transferase